MNHTSLNQPMDEFEYRYVVGIDLGTTNSAVAYVDLDPMPEQRDNISPQSKRDNDTTPPRRVIQTFPIPQLVDAGEIAPRPVLPSFLYLPGAYDLPQGAAALPWDPDRDYMVGEFAREQGARVPARLVASAKSWLSHAQVDRTAAILPWRASTQQSADEPQQVEQISPVTASARYLQHIREAWDAEMATADDGELVEENRLHEQLVVLTVPASFDEVARELTVRASQEAGLPRVILLEEPLAAFYAWLSRHEADWQGIMHEGEIVLVCDMGGGTTDFTTIGVAAGAAGLRFDRLAVGEHLMLGGDNMDNTLGRHIEADLFERPGALEPQRWQQLVYQCRQAKEMLLEEGGREQVDITVVGAGSQLIGGTRSGNLAREQVQQWILDGFFPFTAMDQTLEGRRRGGLTEMGLPYVQDPAVTRHLAGFWRRFSALLREVTGRTALYPDYVLFNGGALAPALIRQRLSQVIASWFTEQTGADWQPRELPNPRPDQAVARGAAYYGLVRLGKGVRVGSGSPRAYYVGVETDAISALATQAQAAGGMNAGKETNGDTLASPPAIRPAVCLVPRGVEEGFEALLDEREFAALTNQPVAFQIFASSTRLGDTLGEVVALAPDQVTMLPPIRTVLRFGRRGEERQLPVQLEVHLTEVGTLEVWCRSKITDHRWQLQFDVRTIADADSRLDEAASADQAPLQETIDHAAVEAAQGVIDSIYASDGKASTAPDPAQLRARLEETLSISKERWPTALIRNLADTLLDVALERGRTAEHEARWLNLAGFCLRPGYGDAVDDWRIKRVWKLYFDGLFFPRQTQNRIEWWIFWRRVAGGLKAGQQIELYNQIRGYVQPDGKARKLQPGMPRSLSGAELLEVWMMFANFEHLTAAMKTELGEWLLQSIGRRPKPRLLWALSRLGARTTVYGPLDRVTPPDIAAHWAQALLKKELDASDSTAQALVLLTRETGDRARNVEPNSRAAVAAWLETQMEHPKRYLELLRNPQSALRQGEQDWIFGEALPSGLVLVATE